MKHKNKMTELLGRLQQASALLAAAKDPEAAEQLLLKGLRQLCNADVAVLLQPDSAQCWRSSLQIAEDTFSSVGTAIEIRWGDEGTGSRLKTPVEQILAQPTGLCCHDPIHAGEYDFSHLRMLETELGQQVSSCLLLPLSIEKEGPGQIAELIRFAKPECTGGFSSEELLTGTILSQQVSAAMAHMHCWREHSELFEALIQLIGSVIDEKSPFARDHCRRVPVLAMMLAQAVSTSNAPAFEAVHLSAADLYELEVAAWLHDIGKLITPIHLSDKATKLEQTFDRFALVAARFEIIRRDMEIARLRAGEKTARVEIVDPGAEQQQMLEDQRFIAACNRGSHSLTEEEVRRLSVIAESYRWIDQEGREVSVLTEDEVANLIVVRGTLNEEEREMINQHVVSTINMLDMLPFPIELARVPEIAGSHHEGYNGQGFPSGLSGAQMPIQARILAFADLFESISAGNRPYRKNNTLNQALQILREMVDGGQVDPELYRLFVEEKLYEGYAIEFLSREQIDPVDRALLLKGL